MKKLLPFLAVLTIAATAAVASLLAQSDARDAERLGSALGLRPGMHVAEIGAGSGGLTVAIAKMVGPTAKVFTTEIDQGRLDQLRRAAEGLPQVVVIEAGATETNLPDGCCDAIFMRDVYHHFTDAAAMNRSLLASLKPGGRLAIFDFVPRGATEAAPGRRGGSVHGITMATLEQELRDAGFRHLSSAEPVSGRNYLIVAEKP